VQRAPKNVDQIWASGRSCYAGLPAQAVHRHSYTPTAHNLCDTARLRCVLNVNACSFLAAQSHSRVLWQSVPLPILIHAKMWSSHTQRTCQCTSSDVSCVESHSILARLDLPPLFVILGPGSPLFSIPPPLPTLSLRPATMPNSKNRAQRGLADPSNDDSGYCSTFTHKIQPLGSLLPLT